MADFDEQIMRRELDEAKKNSGAPESAPNEEEGSAGGGDITAQLRARQAMAKAAQTQATVEKAKKAVKTAKWIYTALVAIVATAEIWVPVLLGVIVIFLLYVMYQVYVCDIIGQTLCNAAINTGKAPVIGSILSTLGEAVLKIWTDG